LSLGNIANKKPGMSHTYTGASGTNPVPTAYVTG